MSCTANPMGPECLITGGSSCIGGGSCVVASAMAPGPEGTASREKLLAVGRVYEQARPSKEGGPVEKG